jgi:hypothetical protein
MTYIAASAFRRTTSQTIDNGLSRHADTRCLPVKGRDNPRGKVDVDALLFLIDTACRREIEIVDDLFLALIKSLIELFSDH